MSIALHLVPSGALGSASFRKKAPPTDNRKSITAHMNKLMDTRRSASILLAMSAWFSIASLTARAAYGQETDVWASIEAGNTAYMDAMANADARSFADVYDRDGTRLGGGGEIIRGRTAIMNQIGSFFTRIGPVTAVLEIADIWTLDSTAYETGRWTYTFTPPGDGRRTIGGRYVTVWKKQDDGSWKILVDMSVPGTEH